MSNKVTKKIWGFDIGPTSIGFAVVELTHGDGNKSVAGKILRLGVRVFPESVDGKAQTPLNQERRRARLQRRQIRRRRWRKLLLRHVLYDAGLLPNPSPQPSNEDFFAKAGDPYELRAKAVEEQLEPHQIGRVLFHIAKHRGVLTSLRTKESETREIIKQINEHEDKLKGRTVGQYLWQEFGPDKQESHRKRRGNHFKREWIEEEFNKIWNKQKEYYPDLLTDELYQRIHRIIFRQLPTYFRLETIGRCELEPDELRCPKGDWYAQQFVMLQNLNNLRFADETELTPEEREELLKHLAEEKELNFNQIRKILGRNDEKFNAELGGQKALMGNATEAELRKIFGPERWETLASRERIRDEIADRLRQIRYRKGTTRIEIRSQSEIEIERKKFIESASKEWNITEQECNALLDLELPEGYVKHSKKAIKKMLPYLEQGLTYHEAKEKAYPSQKQSNLNNQRPSLPLPDRRSDTWRHDIRNPTVVRVLCELRSIVKNLLKKHGRPDLIRVELARELSARRTCPPGTKNCGRCRRCIIKKNKENENRRAEAKEELKKLNIPITRDNITKWILAKEQNYQCIYCGQPLSYEKLFNGIDAQLDHIFPLSRSFDNSLANKVVCCSKCNQEKSNRTPYEAWGTNDDRWSEIKRKLEELENFPARKKQHILSANHPQQVEDFVARQLNDTAYASRYALEYLKLLGVPVEPAFGRVTAELRHRWGLDLSALLDSSPHGNSHPTASTDSDTQSDSSSSSKIREDHRHHAIDALVVALTDRSKIKKLSDYFKNYYEKRIKDELTPLWKDLQSDAKKKIEELVVSHRPLRKVSGKLHEDNPWHIAGENQNQLCLTQRDKPKTTKKTDKRNKERTARIGPNGCHLVILENNHHLVVYQDSSGKWAAELVSLFEAARRLSKKEPIVQKPKNAQKAFTLYKNDILDLSGVQCSDCREQPCSDCSRYREAKYWVITSIKLNGRIKIRPHYAATDKKERSPYTKRLFKIGARKVTVNPIGEVYPAND